MKIIIIPNMPVMAGRHYCLAKTLTEQGHEVHYIMWELPYKISIKQLAKHLVTSLLPKTYTYEQFTVHKAVRLPYFWPVINGLLFKHQLRKIFRQLNADIVITETYTNETEVPADLPFIYDLADDYAAPADVYGSPLYKLAFKLLCVKKIMRRQCQNALAVTAVSETLCKYAQRYNKNVVKLPNGVDTRIIKEIKKNKSIPTKNKYARVYVAGFNQWNRPIDAIKAVVALKKEFPLLELTLIGSGIQTPKIREIIKSNKAESYIHYLGFISDREKMFRIIDQSSIGLNLSIKNSFRDAAHPIKVLEYSALGKKVISTNLEEVKKLTYPNIFIFSDSSKKNNLINTLHKALDDKRTEKDFKTTANNVLREYDWDKVTKNLVKIVKDVKRVHKRRAVIKRVIHISHAYPPALGGLEKVVQALARTQAKAGMNVSVITSQYHSSPLMREDQGEDEDSLVVTRLKPWTIACTRIMPALPVKLSKLNSSDIVHLHIASAYIPEMVLLFSKIKRYKYIAHLHLDLEPTSHAGILLKIYKPFVLRYVLQHAAYVIVFTKEQKNTVHRQYNIDLARIVIIPNGVENVFSQKKQRHLHKKPRLLFVGRLEKQKNIPQLLHALRGISEKFETFVVGEGSLLSEHKKSAKELGLKDINFVGRADGKKLLNYYKKSDIFVLPSEREGMPLALLEAMAMGLPVVATNVNGNRDVIKNNINGFLVKLHDVHGLRFALLQLRSNKNVYKQFSNMSKELAKQYSWTKISAQVTKLYEKNN